jgi:glycosyltransferase involved in cell wall biosynthesis
MGKTRFVYVSGDLRETVTDSQVINWLELYQKQGIRFDLVLIGGLKSYLEKKNTRKNKIREAQERLDGNVYDFFAIKPGTQLYQAMVFGILNLLFMKDILTGSTIILHVRSAATGPALKWLKRFYPRVKIIYDIRGAGAEEYINHYRKESESISSDVESSYRRILNEEISLLDLCDKAFCVSRKLREYFLSKKQFPLNKFEIVPCCADEQLFFYDDAVRNSIRSELGIADDRLVLLYSGGLDRPWQIPDFVFDVFANLYKRDEKIFLICLTPHQEIVDKFALKHHISELDIWTSYIGYHDINRYLNAADIGLLFREDTPTNNVASPTKFAEYLMAGLPVLISRGIGDLSGFVSEHPEVGLVVDHESGSLVDDIFDHLQNRVIRKNTIAAIGKGNFSKSLKVDEVVDVFRSLA